MAIAQTVSLSYVRKARKGIDGADGLLYIHNWGTGFQELIFPDADAANRFADAQAKVVDRSRMNQAQREYQLAELEREGSE